MPAGQEAIEFRRVVEQYPLALTSVTAADGNVYSLPYVNDCFHCAQDRKLWIYGPWLDAVGLPMPQTTEEYYTALKAFRDQNVSGQGTTFPLSSCINSWNNELDLFFMNAFVFNPGEPYLFVQDGTVTASYATEGWREGITYLARLFAEGLIDPEAFTQTPEQLQAKTGGEAGTLVGSAPGGSWGVFITWTPEDPSLRWTDYKLVPALEGPQGVRISAYDPYLPYASGNFIVTNTCPDPRLAFRWADGLYDLATTLRSVQGVLGEQWRWAEPGELGYDGQQAIWSGIPNPPADSPQSVGWIQTGPSFRSSRVRFGEVASDPGLLPTNLDVITRDTLGPYRQPAEWVLPPMFFTEAQVQIVAETETTIVPFVKETLARFVTGEGNVEQEWDGYLAQLDAMGLAPYLEAYQTTYDAQQGA